CQYRSSLFYLICCNSFIFTIRRTPCSTLFPYTTLFRSMRLSMVTAWYMDAGIQPNSFGDWAKLEGNRSKLSELQLLLLEKWDSRDRKSTRLNSSHVKISYAVFCLKKKNKENVRNLHTSI